MRHNETAGKEKKKAQDCHLHGREGEKKGGNGDKVSGGGRKERKRDRNSIGVRRAARERSPDSIMAFKRRKDGEGSWDGGRIWRALRLKLGLSLTEILRILV